jgi:hypothetical protein
VTVRSDINRSPYAWVIIYLFVCGLAALAAFVWHGMRWDFVNLAVLILTAWILWLHIDRVNLVGYAEQAADDSDHAARQNDKLVELVHHLIDRIDVLEERIIDLEPAEPVTVLVRGPETPPTEPMARAWDTSAAQLSETQEMKAVTKTVGGHTFTFRS